MVAEVAIAQVLDAFRQPLDARPGHRLDAIVRVRGSARVQHQALEGVQVTSCIHLCFGYGFVVSANKPKAYAFLSQLADCVVDQISIEAAQPHLDLGVLKDLSNKAIVLGVVDLSNNDVESVGTLVARIQRALPYVAPERLIAAPDCGMKYLPRPVAFGKLKALAEGAAIVRRELS